MAFDLSNIQNDLDAIDDGAWKTLSDTANDKSWSFEVKLRSELSDQYLAVETRIFTALRENAEGELSPRDRVMAKLEAIVEGALVDWRGLDLDGAAYPFSLENARRLFLTQEFQRVGEKLLFAFQSNTEFLKKRQIGREKNLSIASSLT